MSIDIEWSYLIVFNLMQTYVSIKYCKLANDDTFTSQTVPFLLLFNLVSKCKSRECCFHTMAAYLKVFKICHQMALLLDIEYSILSEKKKLFSDCLAIESFPMTPAEMTTSILKGNIFYQCSYLDHPSLISTVFLNSATMSASLWQNIEYGLKCPFARNHRRAIV